MQLQLILLALVGAVKHHPMCVSEGEKLLFLHEANPRTTDVSLVQERALDYCALKESVEKKYICPFFAQFVADAYSHVNKKDSVSPSSFCTVAEDHAYRMEAQIKGVRELRNEETVDDTCEKDVTKAMLPESSVAQKDMPDFMYLFCIHHHDCEHQIPARTRSCSLSAIPHMSATTCELLRGSAESLVEKLPQDGYDAETICSWLAGVGFTQAERLEAYEYVMYGEVAERSLIPESSLSDHALMSSQLTNGATAHYLRDHHAHPVSFASLPAVLVAAMVLA